MKIVEYIDSANIVIEFQDNFKHRVSTIYSNFRSGAIKNPYDKNICGMAFRGVGKHVAYVKGKHTKEYSTWISMIKRCYFENEKEIHNTYFGIATVCEEWLNFENFADWYDKNYYEIGDGKRMHLDKDILHPGNKVYSPDNCIFVPQRINLLFSNKKNNRGVPNGVYIAKNGYESRYNGVKLGVHETIEEAFAVYAKRKEETIEQIANDYYDYIPRKVYNALIGYEVRIENDKNYVVKTHKNNVL